MHHTLLTLPILLLSLLPLVSGDACVAGGPAAIVKAAEGCCLYEQGTWYQFYDVQAICVLDSFQVWKYKRCLELIPDGGDSLLDTTCITGDAAVPSGATTTETASATLTARAF